MCVAGVLTRTLCVLLSHITLTLSLSLSLRMWPQPYLSTCQIVGTISWTLEVQWPTPYRAVRNALRWTNLEFPYQCFSQHLISYYDTVYITAAVPLVLGALVWVVFYLRVWYLRPDAARRLDMMIFHSTAFLVVMCVAMNLRSEA